MVCVQSFPLVKIRMYECSHIINYFMPALFLSYDWLFNSSPHDKSIPLSVSPHILTREHYWPQVRGSRTS